MNDAEKRRRAKAEADERRREHLKQVTDYVKGLEQYEPIAPRKRNEQ